MSHRRKLLVAAGLVALGGAGCAARPPVAVRENALSSTWPRRVPRPRAGAVLVGSLNHLCMRPASGPTYCIGSNLDRELGATDEFDLPARADRFFSDDRDLHLGSSMGCAIAANGTTRCWGSPVHGGRGDDCTINRHGLHACGGREVAFDRSAGQVSQVQVPALRELAGGWDHTCGRSDDGEVWCWGSNASGQLGRPELDQALRPVRVDVPPAIELHSGVEHTCTVSRDTRDIWCWGDHDIDDEPDPMERDVRSPKRMAKRLPAGARLRLVQRGGCVVGGDARIACWGRVAIDEDGSLASTGLDIVSDHALANQFSCVLDLDRQVACYAAADFVGDADDADGQRWRSVAVPTRAPIAELYASRDYACAISEVGEVACWGNATLGSLDLAAPRLVLDPARLPR